jgi:hypothetical protein
VERQRLEQKTDTKTAVDAALAAAKEAVGQQTEASERSITKSENATAKQAEETKATFRTEISGLVSAISDLKERVGKIESIKQGASQTYMGMYALAGFILVVLSIAAIVLGVRH